MCGIAGIVVPPGSRVPTAVLQRMTDTLHRRGPDDSGVYVDAAGGCGLGHRRLSIIDLEGGHQPLSAADGQVQAIVNGEIYNFKVLRSELQAHGHVFKTNSDSEVVAHGYAQWGTDVIDRLQGMFALAIWDLRTRRLVLARDRMGQKPLYYAFVGAKSDTLIFGSELKALAMHPDLDRNIDPTALASYLAFECLPEGESIYRQSNKLPPATAMVYDRDRSTTRIFEYWSMRFTDAPTVPDISRWTEDQITEHLRGLIEASTRARLISDVPLGVFLSGGIDSSTIAAAMAQSVPGKQIKTFSISFEDKSFDESEHARRVAKHLGTDHHEEVLSPKVMLDILPEVADFMCEPIGDASIIPTYLLSRFARRTVTVALGGDGGDELFLGYPTFVADKVARRLDSMFSSKLEGTLGRGLLKAAKALPVGHNNFSFDFKVKRFAQGLGWSPDMRHQAWMGSFMPSELEGIFTEDFRKLALARNPYATVAAFRERTEPRDHYDEMVYQYARLYLAGCVLTKVDRASMAVGLEVRAPLLDTKVVEFACALPGDMKLRGMTTKYVLKKAARAWLPPEIIDRPKKGFGIPVGAWLRGPLRGMAYDMLTSRQVRQAGYFDMRAMKQLIDDHDAGVADNRKQLWTLLAFHLWHERYGPGTRSDAPEDDAPPDVDGSSSVLLRC